MNLVVFTTKKSLNFAWEIAWDIAFICTQQLHVILFSDLLFLSYLNKKDILISIYVDKSIHILLDQRKPFPFILWQWLVTLIFIFRFYDYWRRIVWTKVSFPFRIRLMLNFWHNGHRNLNSRLWCCYKDKKIFFH